MYWLNEMSQYKIYKFTCVFVFLICCDLGPYNESVVVVTGDFFQHFKPTLDISFNYNSSFSPGAICFAPTEVRYRTTG
jgi:hypothetical protein